MSLKNLSIYFAAACLALSITAPAQTASPAEARAARSFAAARKAGDPELYAFLKPFPKGADLHMHLSGAIYAETFLAEAAQQNLCVDPIKLSLIPNVGTTRSLPPQAVCPKDTVAATAVLQDQSLYDHLINSLSMRSFVPYAGYSGHDQFFDTFNRFGAIKNVQGQWLDEIATRAAAQNEQYLEIMHTPSFNHVFSSIAKIQWPTDLNDDNHIAVLAKLRDQLFANGLRENIVIDTKEFKDAQDSRHSMEYCNGDSAGPVTLSTTPTTLQLHMRAPACTVQIHFLYQVLRGFPPAQVFAQTLLGFELASTNPDVVGINFVRAEDRRDAMAEYHTEMLMLDYLHSVYPKVRITLHAGELAPGIVPPAGLSFHIREALDLGHAERIGHGVDILHEDRPAELLKQMADHHIMVEINLTSNDVILGIKGTDHPLAAYRAAHVPLALSTDDEGVSRIDLTHEYVRGALEQNLTYADLKTSARTSLEHSFLPGPSLWGSPDNFTRRVSACAAPITTKSLPPGPCEAFLKTSERATQQYELELRLATFESNIR